MRQLIIGTAGHIDHGKTTLIKALTGRDTDRLEEEKRRGITIDLGFTWLDLAEGKKAGVIDVPGHEKFIRNMAAGAAGMDLVLLVIAADEGVMPQTVEHLEILRLLGVEHYIVVLNKCDLVQSEWIELVEEQIRDELSELLPADAPVICVSAVTGMGMEQLEECIEKSASEITREENALLRLPVDRVFTMPGYGTVVTGTVSGGSIRKDEILTVFPSDQTCRVRGIQVYNEDAEECMQGQRAALNLTGVSRERMKRGCVLARPGTLKIWRFCHARLSVLKHSARTITNQMRLHLYSGTSEFLCRAVLLDAEKIGPGESGFVRLCMESDAVMCRGDRFVVRFYSPVETIGGGIILETGVRKEKRFSADLLDRLSGLETGNAEERMLLCLKHYRGTMAPMDALAADMGMTEQEAEKTALELLRRNQAEVFSSGSREWIWRKEDSEKMQEQIVRKIRSYLSEHPYRKGMPYAELVRAVFEKAERGPALSWMEQKVREGILERSGNIVSVPGCGPWQDEAYETVRRAVTGSAGRAGYRFAEIPAADFGKVSPEEVEEICMLLKDQGIICEVVPGVWTTPEIMDDVLRKVGAVLNEKGRITISEVRDLFGTGRKNARMILEYTDRAGITQKSGGESERMKKQ